MKKIYLFTTLLVLYVNAFAQTVTLSFTGRDANNDWVQLNRVDITNQTQNWSETIFWPDTTLTMHFVTGIDDYVANSGLSLSQNNPNPFYGTTDVLLSVADVGTVNVKITDLSGRVIETQNFTSLPIEDHQFRISLSTAGTYVMTVLQNGKTSSIKMVNKGGGNGNRIEYTGTVRTNNPKQQKSDSRGITNNPFTFGDMMKYIMYATINGVEDTVVVSQQQTDAQEIVMTFETTQTDWLPCPGSPTLTDIDGNMYNTVMLGNQCWMKENLRTTRYANNSAIPVGSTWSNTTPYRYTPDNAENNVSTYGYLYNWAAVMNGASSSDANPSGVQGICPNGWHVPSDAEWTQLTDYVSSHNEYVCGGNNTYIAKALAATTGWDNDEDCANYECAVGNNPVMNNTTGFSALPAGSYGDYGYDNFGFGTLFWSATEHSNSNAYFRSLQCDFADVLRYFDNTYNGLSVRCIRNGGSGGGSTTSIPTVNTEMVFNIGTNSANCYGNVTSGGSASVTARGVCWSTSQNPTTATNWTLDGNGMGLFSSSITGLTPNTTYHVRAYAINEVGTAYGEEVVFTTVAENVHDGEPCVGTSTLTDIDGHVYNTVQIGNQCWMKENLRTTRYADGVPIPYGGNMAWSATSPYYYTYSELSASYGYFYNWPATVRGTSGSNSNPSGVQGVCPTGWHVPSSAEWSQLLNYVSSKPQYYCNGYSIAKALASSSGWYIHDYEMVWEPCQNPCAIGNYVYANNATGFSALPTGMFDHDNDMEMLIDGVTSTAAFWSTMPGVVLSMDVCEGVEIYAEEMLISSGASVRCVKD